jgi:predicted secreted protein
MALRTFFAIGWIFISVTLVSCTPPLGSTVRIGESAAGSTVELRQGQILEVALPGNPTTGFTWQVRPGAESILAQQGEAKFAPQSSAIGSGGTITVRFLAVAKGKVILILDYHRPWEAGVAPLQTYQATVVVER